MSKARINVTVDETMFAAIVDRAAQLSKERGRNVSYADVLREIVADHFELENQVQWGGDRSKDTD